jgi:C1A family cysteine protease
MRYKLAFLFLLGVAGALALFLLLHHRGAGNAPQSNVAPSNATLSCDGNAPGTADPAAAYCRDLGYTYEVVSTSEGQHGVCVLPDSSRCDAWGFLEGKCGQAYSYCAKQGYDLEIRSDGNNPLSRQYSVCVQDQAQIGAVTGLMRLSEEATKGVSAVQQSPSPASEPPSAGLDSVAVPSSFDWRNYNGQDWMTSVKDQGGCGSCWAFSAVGIVEPAYNISTGNPNLDLDLSEEYLVSDCLTGQNCCGGWTGTALSFIRDSGISDEACFPYADGSSCTCSSSCGTNCTYRGSGQCSDRTCSNRCADWSSRLTRIQSAGSVAASVSSIKEALVEKGPLSVAMGILGGVGGHWDGDIYRCTDDSSINHGVVIAGYNDAGGYWIVKNSWGSSWNGDGYFKVGYGECAIEDYVYYAVASGLDPTSTATPTATPTTTATATSTPTATPTPSINDTDHDGVSDSLDNCPSVYNPGQENTDAIIDNGPGIADDDTTIPNAMADAEGDACETDGDIDNDGLPDSEDTNPLGATGVCAAYAGASDGHPNPAGGNVTNDDNHDGDPAPPMGPDVSDNGPSWDTDNDGYLDGYECTHGSNPRDRASTPSGLPDDKADSDGDGLQNGWERRGWGTDPNVVDSDGDGLGDCKEVADLNGDGVVSFVGDAVPSAKASLLTPASFGKTMDFDINKDGVVSFIGDTVPEANLALIAGLCK